MLSILDLAHQRLIEMTADTTDQGIDNQHRLIASTQYDASQMLVAVEELVQELIKPRDVWDRMLHIIISPDPWEHRTP